MARAYRDNPARYRSSARLPWGRYLVQARRPWHSLLLLAPLMMLYEIGAALARRGGAGWSLLAPGTIAGLLAWFGLAGAWVPPVTFIVVMLAWHRLRGDLWYIRPLVLPFMVLEGMLWALPLLVISTLFPPGARFWGTTVGQQILISLGAGVYEELVFRLLLISALCWLLERGLDLRGEWNRWTAAGLAAIVFALCHFAPLGRDAFAWAPFWFRLAAGAYLSVVYLRRGLGVAGVTHVAYNVLLILVRGAGD
jgi:membrane protease YdiL (CAAX protease family)